MPPKLNPKLKAQTQSLQAPMVVAGGRRPTRISLGNKPLQFKDDDDTTELGERGEEEWMQAKALVKPDDQLQLTDTELKEEFTRILTANNPHAPQNIVRYSFKEKQYKQIPNVDQLAIHFALDGNMLHKDSDEARRQMAAGAGGGDAASEHEASDAPAAAEEKQEEEGEKADTEGEEGKDGEASATPAPSEKGQKLTNQFNFSERASQTYNNPYRERGTATEPPPRANFSGSVTQWEIFDAYQEDFEKQV